MKTLNLTQSHAQNDLINSRIQGFSFRNFENKVWHSRCGFFQLGQLILDFKHSLNAKMSLGDEELKRFSDCGVQIILFA